ncbi:MAG: 5'-3' exonuclease H3TH domain-containing protein, partial [Dehalococcoidia bacterium]
MVHRAFHAIQQPMTLRSTGEEVRGVYGFANTFLKVLADWNPAHCAIAFDMRAPTFRHLKYKEYKAHRPEAPPELYAQFPKVRQLMEAFEVPIYEMEGFEADDILGTLSRLAAEQELETIILTGDTDTLQLVSPWVRVLLQHSVQKREIYDVNAVRERYGGLGPTQQPDIKGLQGDPSDNIPGVPGIGTKTAVKLIQEFGSIEELYQNLDSVTPPRIQELLREHREQAFQGKELTTIFNEMDIELDLEAMRFGGFDREKVLATFREFEFSRMVDRIPGATVPVQGMLLAEERPTSSTNVQRDYVTVDTAGALSAMLEELRSG